MAEPTDATKQNTAAFFERKKERAKFLSDSDAHYERLVSNYQNDGILDPMLTAVGGINALPHAPGLRVFGMLENSPVDAHYICDVETFGNRPEVLHFGCFMSMSPNKEAREPVIFYDYTELLGLLINTMLQKKRTKVWAHYGSRFDWFGFAYSLGCNYGSPVHFELSDEQLGIAKENAEPVKKGRGRPKKEKLTHVKIDIQVMGTRNTIVITAGDHRMELTDSYFHLEAPLAKLGAKGATPRQYTDPLRWLAEHGFEGYEAGKVFWHNHIEDEAIEYCVNDCHILAGALLRYQEFGMSRFNVDFLNHMTAPKAGLAALIAHSPAPSEFPTPLFLVHDPKNNNSRSVKGYPDMKLYNEDQLRDLPMQLKFKNRPLFERGEAQVTDANYFCGGDIASSFDRVMFGGRTEVFANMTADGMRPMTIDAKSMYPSVMSSGELMPFLDPRTLKPLADDIVGREAILSFLKHSTGMFVIESMPGINPDIKKYPIFPIRAAGKDRDARIAFAHWNGKIRLYVTGEELRYFLEISEVENNDIKILAKDSYAGRITSHTRSPLFKFANTVFRERKIASDAGDDVYSMICKLLMNSASFGSFSETREENEELKLPKKPDTESMTPAEAHMAEADYHVRLQASCRVAHSALNALFRIDPIYEKWETDGEIFLQKKPALTMLTVPEFEIESLDKDQESAEPWPVMTDDEMRAYINKAFKFVREWSNDHWRNSDTFVQSDGTTVMPIMIKQYLAAHAIKPWAVQITAASRVALHRTIIKVVNAGFQVCYCDTDSVHFGIPSNMTDQQAVDKLRESGVKMAWTLEDKRVQDILRKNSFNRERAMANKKAVDDILWGDDHGGPRIRLGGELTEWAVEALKIDPELMVPGATEKAARAIFLAPKAYVYIDQNKNILRSVVKGIPNTHPAMRAAMVAIIVSHSRMGAKSGMSLNDTKFRDALDSAPTPRRSMYSAFDSNAIVLSQPKAIADQNERGKPFTNLDYCKMIGGQFKVFDSLGVRIARNEFFSCSAFGINTMKIRGELENIKDEIIERILDEEADPMDRNELSNLLWDRMAALKEVSLMDLEAGLEEVEQ